MKKKFNIKRWLRPLMGLGIGALIGVAFAASLFAVPVIREFLKGPMSDSGMLVFMLYWFGAMAIAVVAVFAQIILHEAGHLVAGLLSGYRVVSFRVFNLMVVRRDDGLHFGRFSIAGTGGQCLMEPREQTLTEAEQMPYALYLAGGVVANALVSLVAIVVLAVGNAGVLCSCVMVMLALSGMYLAITNGVPMRIGGVANDGDNIRTLRRDRRARQLLWVQLKVNALYTRGVMYRDMPDEWFEVEADADMSNYLYATIVAMHSSQAIERHDFDAAYNDLMRLHRASGLIELLRREADCELLLPAVMLRRPRWEVERLMSGEGEQYARLYAQYMLSRRVTLYVLERFVRRNVEAAAKEAEAIRRVAANYPSVGESRSSLEMLEYLEGLNDEDYAID